MSRFFPNPEVQRVLDEHGIPDEEFQIMCTQAALVRGPELTNRRFHQWFLGINGQSVTVLIQAPRLKYNLTNPTTLG